MSELESQYQQTLEYLYSFVDFSLQRNFRYVPGQFELGRMRDLAAALGDPQNSYPTIHVAGTKGKGSVSVLCASALQAAGYRVGLYTSPHLDDYAERIQIDGQQIPHAELIALVDELKPVIESIPKLSTFEITTALAFLYFARQGVTVAVIEVGLGGRLDATNILNPRVTVITSLSYDHTALLGNTLAEIAGEKAGIIKPGVPVVVSPQLDEARRVLERVAEEQKAPLIQVGQDLHFKPLSYSLAGQELLVWNAADQVRFNEYLTKGGNSAWQPVKLRILLLGHHQAVNAATAYAVLRAARAQGLAVGEDAIRQGFQTALWPGRFEVLRDEAGSTVVLDCAHNRDSALKLRLALEDYFPGKAVVMVFGASEDKDVQGMFSELLPRVRQLIAVKSFHPRAMDPEILLDLAHQVGCPARIVPDVADALDEALRLAGQEAIVLVTGSIFVAAGARIHWFANRSINAGK
jgi:dihydrofolate synthase/folylpolyglutamate synthase